MLTRLPANIDAVNRQIHRFSGLRFQWPVFPSALESRFERDTAGRRSRRLWLEGLIAIALFDLFLIADYFSSPQDFRRAFVLRLLIITPICLIVNASMLQKPDTAVRETSIAFASCLAGATQLYLEANKSATASAYVQMAVLAVLLFTNIVMRLRFPYALASSAAMLAADWVFLRVDRMLTGREEVLGIALAIATTAITLVANYSAGREERLNYLLNLRDELMVEDLNRLNAQLLRRSESDALTGLANRHSFDTQYAELWKRALTSGTGLSVIVVDVDNFKMLNDRYGHLYGDEVLRRIGSLLQQALRAKDDFAARFGGEEFVILLPGTHQPAAAQVAERICKMVELAGFPALDSSHKPYDSNTVATVSCGVATAYPTLRDRAEDLLEAADKAMYQAKANGRNCVACARYGAAIADRARVAAI
ncbi:MAG: GGDEF domain-containing protein [Acidobacteria bacterium]|nr:GGDEF domain-containing protein [Acidobacteriota bacterium]